MELKKKKNKVPIQYIRDNIHNLLIKDREYVESCKKIPVSIIQD